MEELRHGLLEPLSKSGLLIRLICRSSQLNILSPNPRFSHRPITPYCPANCSIPTRFRSLWILRTAQHNSRTSLWTRNTESARKRLQKYYMDVPRTIPTTHVNKHYGKTCLLIFGCTY